MNTSFHLQQLNDPKKMISTFFSGDDELAEIKRCPVPRFSTADTTFETLGETCILIAGFVPYFFSTATLYVVSCVANLLFLQNVANYAHLLSSRIESILFFEPVLVRSINNHALNTGDVFNLSPIKRNEIQSNALKELINLNKRKISFGRAAKGGVCHGGAWWFIHLLKKYTLHSKKSLFEMIYAVAKQFENGQPKQAALLQALYGSHALFLNYKTQKPFIAFPETIEKALRKLEDGIAYCATASHAMVYVQKGDEQFLWDPNYGLYQLKSKNQLKDLLLNYPSPYYQFTYLA